MPRGLAHADDASLHAHINYTDYRRRRISHTPLLIAIFLIDDTLLLAIALLRDMHSAGRAHAAIAIAAITHVILALAKPRAQHTHLFIARRRAQAATTIREYFRFMGDID